MLLHVVRAQYESLWRKMHRHSAMLLTLQCCVCERGIYYAVVAGVVHWQKVMLYHMMSYMPWYDIIMGCLCTTCMHERRSAFVNRYSKNAQYLASLPRMWTTCRVQCKWWSTWWQTHVLHSHEFWILMHTACVAVGHLIFNSQTWPNSMTVNEGRSLHLRQYLFQAHVWRLPRVLSV